MIQNTNFYTELRANADEIRKYTTYASSKDIDEVANLLNSSLNKSYKPTSSALNELLLGTNEPIPLHSELIRKFNTDPELTKNITFSQQAYKPFASKTGLLKEKSISLAYHNADERSSITSVLTDISAIFCTMMPSIELSLCSPYFEANIIYPSDNSLGNNSNIPKLNLLKFVGANPKSKLAISNEDQPTKFGFDVVGMEIFGVPQTLAPTSEFFKTTSAYQERGVDVLDPISPLMTVENASIQQVGVGGGLIIQSKINLSLILHDRSRLSDIEPLTTADIFPLVTFRITYGWTHPDANKMSGNVYAKFINSMRTTQDYAVVAVSVSTKDALSLKIDLTLVGTGSSTIKSAKIISANGELIPYSSLNSMMKQFIAFKSDKDKSPSANFSSVGSTIISSVSKAAASTKFIPIDSYYSLYEKLKTNIRKEDLVSIINDLNSLRVVEVPATDFQKLFKFEKAADSYGQIKSSVLTTNSQFISTQLANQVQKQAKESLNLTDTDVPQAVVPLAEMLSHAVAKPLLAALPDLDEVRIHCFSFNTACGLMAAENIGNFPINKSELLQSKELEINPNTAVQSIINEILKNVNNPASIFYGFSSDYDRALNAKKALETPAAPTEEAAEAAQNKVDTINDQLKSDTDEKNHEFLEYKKQYLGDKIGSTDLSYVPPRVKIMLDFLPAYDASSPNQEGMLVPNKKIARITVYDERCKGFNKLGNLLFSMMNTNGIAKMSENSSAINSDIIKFIAKSTETKGTNIFQLNDKKLVKEVASKLYPAITIGAEGTLITNASFSSQPSGEMQSSYFLTALNEQRGSSQGADSDSSLIDDVFIIPSSITLNMAGNICISIGQIYYVDFNTGTTIDNAYIVTSVSHSIKPGEFTTTATLMPMSSATVRTVKRQIQELVTKIQGAYGFPLPLTTKSITALSKLVGTATRK